MDRYHWMYEIPHATKQYLASLNEFLEVAETYRVESGDVEICCPCKDCKNEKKFSDCNVLKDHLIRRGFTDMYTCWIYHGEYLDDDDDNIVARDYNENDNIFIENDNLDNINGMLQDLEDEVANANQEKFQKLFDDSEESLYNECKYTKLSAVLKLYNIKAKYGWSDRSFTELLKFLRLLLPNDNKLPVSTYKAKRLMCPMGLKIERINACPNDCILYRNEYADLHQCVRCGTSRYKGKNNGMVEDRTGIKDGIPAKILWYLPIIPRLKRLFANAKDAKLLRWHAEERKIDGKIRHVADSPQWRNIDSTFEEFGEEIRNIRFGLSSDGINPFGNMSSRHSTWPVLLCIYNLPPWLCMKRRYIMMSLLIQGPKQPGNNIDVYLAPLVDDLKQLWSTGVEVFDAYKEQRFQLRALLYCTINDFPAYGNLSGYSTKGKKACPVCQDDTYALRLNHCRKHVFMGHRRYLTRYHPYRKLDAKLFDGQIAPMNAPKPLNGKAVYSQVKDINIVFGKGQKSLDGIWKKKSIFWELPYWEHLQVRHCLDVMHIEKNVCDSLIGLLLNIQGKTKDGINVRKDMVDLGIRPELAPVENGKRTWLPTACYTMSKKEKTSFCKCLHGVKVPSGYSANIKKLVSLKDLKLIGMKSHDCHILMTQLIPIAIRGILPNHIRHTITKLCLFFNMIHSKVIDPEVLDTWQKEIVVTLCQLEMYFPPSFFDVMVHLISHIVEEIKACGPVFLRYMYPFERYMGFLKGYVRNRSRPEGSIAEGYVAEEVIDFCTDYLADAKSIGIPQSRHEGRLSGAGTIGLKYFDPDYIELQKAHLYVLENMTAVAPYVHEHMAVLRDLNQSMSDFALATEHNKTFAHWLKERVKASYGGERVDQLVERLAYGPRHRVATYQGYDINGYTFYTKGQDDKSTLQNSGVTLIAMTSEFSRTNNDARSRIAKDSYYGVIQEIWELDYNFFSIPLFKCKWVENRRGVKVDDYGFTLVDLSREGYLSEPFILANQASQVFFVEDPKDSKLHIVLHGKRHILGLENVTDEEEYDKFDELPPFFVDTSTSNVPINARSYLRTDHNEGLWVVENETT